MKVRTATALSMLVLTSVWAFGSLTVTAQSNSNDNRIAMLDNCDPSDPDWPAPGCFKRGGDVSVAEFFALLTTGLGSSLIGHPSWRNEPSYITARSGTDNQSDERGWA